MSDRKKCRMILWRWSSQAVNGDDCRIRAVMYRVIRVDRWCGILTAMTWPAQGISFTLITRRVRHQTKQFATTPGGRPDAATPADLQHGVLSYRNPWPAGVGPPPKTTQPALVKSQPNIDERGEFGSHLAAVWHTETIDVCSYRTSQIYSLLKSSYFFLSLITFPVRAAGIENWPAPFPGRMS